LIQRGKRASFVSNHLKNIGVYMKNKINLFGVIALSVIISLLTIGCPEKEEKEEEPTVTSVTITPSTARVAKGANLSFSAKVIGTNNPAQTVTWSIVETGKNSGTSISTSGLLTIAAAETLPSLTVKATSKVDTAKNGTITVTVTELDSNASGVQIFTANSGGNKSLSGTSYGYEMWTEGGNNNKLIWYGPNQGGGAAFRAEWNNPNDFLGRIGYYWGNGGPYTTYKNMYAEFTYTRSGRSTAGNYSYIGIYGWGRNPSASNANEKLIEYYIVEDWFGNQWQGDTSPMGTGTTQGSVVSSYTLDGAIYQVHKSLRTNKPSIDGTKTFTQFFSIRQTLRKSGTISITEHFKKWESLNMNLGNMYECKFLVEAGGGTGWLDLSYLKFSQEESPR
jgi:endo-1,4-beta-xylanase